MADQGHGGHAASWIVTYCDMITLLIACFIMIITFGSKEKGHLSPRSDSIVNGQGGSGVVGPEHQGADRDALVWRLLPSPGRTTPHGSELPPLYSDPNPDATPEVVRRLEADQTHTLADSYQLQMPLGLLFNDQGDLTPGGIQWLHAIGRNIRALPYDLMLQVDDPRQLPRAIKMSHYFATKEAIHPGRIGVGLRAAGSSGNTSVALTLVRRPS